MSVMGTLGAIALALAFGALMSSQEKKEKEDRKNNPEKWAKIDAEKWNKEAEDYWYKYNKAMTRIPLSEWIVMNRVEKSNVFKKRENLKSEYEELHEEVKSRIKKQYSVDVTFPYSN